MKFTTNDLQLSQSLAWVSLAQSTEDLRDHLGGVSVSLERGKLVLRATDAYRLHEGLVTGNAKDKTGTKSGLMSSGHVSYLLGVLPKKTGRVPSVTTVTIEIDKAGLVHTEYKGHRMASGQDVAFPDHKKLWPDDAKELGKIDLRALPPLKASKTCFRPVVLVPSEKPIIVMCGGESFDDATGVNPRYLADVKAGMDAPLVEWASPLKPMVFRSGDRRALVMPIRLSL